MGIVRCSSNRYTICHLDHVEGISMSKSASTPPSRKGGTLHKPGRESGSLRDTSFDSGKDHSHRAMVAEAAYFRSERRGFAPGHEVEDWLACESELDAQVNSESLKRSTVLSGDMH
jgi:hypothetical protein